MATAICYQLDSSLTSPPVSAFAGLIDTPTGPVLPALDAVGTNIGFSPDSLSVMWSTSSSTTTPAETLKVQKIGDNTTRMP